MKNLVGGFALAAAALITGSALAQTAPPPRAPNSAPSVSPPPATGTVRPGGGWSEDREMLTRGEQERREPAAGSQRLESGTVTVNSSDDSAAPRIGGQVVDTNTNIGGLNAVNPVEACTARGGQMTANRGVQQCRLPAAVPSPGNRGPGTIPPRN